MGTRTGKKRLRRFESIMQSSECHREAVKAVVLPRQTRDIAEAFSEETRKQREVNRKVFLRILENHRCDKNLRQQCARTDRANRRRCRHEMNKAVHI